MQGDGGSGLSTFACDVLVVGSGLAGLCAAVEAAGAGRRVLLASAGRLCSGSSFYRGTWGMGLVGPLPGDEDDLAQTILAVGCGAADPVLVRALVEGIRPGMAWLEGLGVELRRPGSPEAAREAAYIPCFDERPRLWRGIEHGSLAAAMARALERREVELRTGWELVELLREPDGSTCGALLFDARAACFSAVHCGAVVLATGGAAALFERRLAPGAVLASGQGIALAHGCRLVNAEFIQFMPGLVAPAYGVVFNEKTFRSVDAAALGLSAELLELRSGHGPFTTRLGDAAVDLAIDAAGEEGLPLRYRATDGPVPEFVEAFSSWLEREHGVGRRDELRLAIFAQASNGGLAIDCQGATDVPGLYACGEAAGGMHGADRLGGLSSANCLVFGRRAGAAAARWASEQGFSGCPAQPPHALLDRAAAVAGGCGLGEARAAELTRALRQSMSAHCVLNRTDPGLRRARDDIKAMEAQVDEALAAADGPTGPRDRARALRLRHQLAHAAAIVGAMRARGQSCGPHHRLD